ncbi:MAG TPA: ectoine/hydroxyectoine ABC transporter substrate-binding protein EhuB [Spirochaetota bacterium]|nr:ectoine/hydroxyectoine ABC transporter substrate-binding protein EhuB [Spirochaetota bacterium]
MRFRSITFIIVSLLFLVSCGERTNTLDRMRKEGVVTIGVANEVPYGYKTPDGKVKGEAPEVIKLVMERMGVKKINAVVTEFGSLIPGLKAGRFDIIAAGLYITPKRCRQVAFTNPTYSIGEGFLVKKGNPKNLHSYDDVKNSNNVKLGAVAATVELGYARKAGIPEERIVIFPDNISAVAGVKSGRIDALATTSITVAKLAEKEPAVEKAVPFTDPVIDGKSVRGYGALAVRKGDRKLLEVLNAHLREVIGSDAHRKAVRQYGFTEENLPGNVDASSLCGD